MTVAYGLGCCSAWREGQPEWDVLERPDVPRPAEIASLETGRGVPVPLQLRDAPARGAARRRLDARRRAARRPTRCCSPRSPTPGSRRPSRTWSIRPSSRPSTSRSTGARRPACRARRASVGARRVLHPPRRGRDVGGGRRAVERGRRPARAVAPARDRAQPTVIGHLGLGSNVGDRRAHLQAAVDALPRARRARAGVVVGLRHRAGRRGARPAGVPQRGRARRRLSCEPEALLDACKAVERELGRAAGGVRHGPRPIDVDVLLLGRRVVLRPSGCGCRMREVTSRRFVLVPLLEVTPDVTLPDGRWSRMRCARWARARRCAARGRRCGSRPENGNCVWVGKGSGSAAAREPSALTIGVNSSTKVTDRPRTADTPNPPPTQPPLSSLRQPGGRQRPRRHVPRIPREPLERQLRRGPRPAPPRHVVDRQQQRAGPRRSGGRRRSAARRRSRRARSSGRCARGGCRGARGRRGR